jgi:hypothetical protein
MTFTQKGEDIIRNEVVEDLKVDDDNFDEDANKGKIDRIVQRRLKDEEMKASLWKQKSAKQEELEKKAEELARLAKGQDNPPKPEDKGKGQNKPDVSVTDMSWFFAKGGTRTELRYVQKVMGATGKDFRGAMNDPLFKAWKKENDKMLESRKAQLDPSRGGTAKQKASEDDKLVEEMSRNLPAGFSAKPKVKK